LTEISQIEKSGKPVMMDTGRVVHDIGDMIPGYVQVIGRAKAFQVPAQDYSILFTARNGGWAQEYRARQVKGVWTYATVVLRDVGNLQRVTVLAIRSPQFPDADLPNSWPKDGVQITELVE
jgi:hypothetical protein